MQNKFQSKYRISSARLQSWDYSINGAYFITICTQNREHFFGKIVNHEMQLFELGKLAQQFWIEIPIHFPFVELGNFVVMPNHIHGILIINNPVETRFIASHNVNKNVNKNEINDEINFVIEKETRLIASLQEKISDKNIGGICGDKNPMLQNNISKIIRWYKGRCSYESRKIDSNFGWQSRFHDHVIRNSKSFETIQNYIFENPSKWENDKFH